MEYNQDKPSKETHFLRASGLKGHLNSQRHHAKMKESHNFKLTEKWEYEEEANTGLVNSAIPLKRKKKKKTDPPPPKPPHPFSSKKYKPEQFLQQAQRAAF